MRILSLCAVFLLILSLSVPAFAVEPNELDVYDFASSITIDGTNEIVKANLPLSWSWKRYHNDTPQQSADGIRFSYTTQMRYVDNDVITGENPSSKIIPAEGIPSGLTVSGNFGLTFEVTNQSQPYTIYWKLECLLLNKGWAVIDSITLADSSQHGTSAPTSINFPWSFDTSELSNAYGFRFFLTIDLAGVDDESDTTTVTVDTSSTSASIIIPFSQLYRLQEQTFATNKLLEGIDSALQENGQKLDDIIQEQENINNKLDDIINNTVPSVRPDGQDKVDDLDDAEAGLRDDASSGLDEGLRILDDALDILVTYTQAFSALGLIFGYFAGIPFFSALLYLSFALGILATILGVGLSVASRFGNSHSNREGKSSSGGKSK